MEVWGLNIWCEYMKKQNKTKKAKCIQPKHKNKNKIKTMQKQTKTKQSQKLD